MNMDKRHLAAAAALLAGSVTYNVWAFGTPEPQGETSEPAAAATVDEGSRPTRPIVAGGGLPPHVTRASEAAADVMLDRPPVWARDPFMGRPAAPTAADAPVAAAPAAVEADVTLDSVLYSSTRRLAMVNGRTVRIGEQVGGATVVDILPDAIVVESASGGIRTIRRRTPGMERAR
jgi:hypothetical protein